MKQGLPPWGLAGLAAAWAAITRDAGVTLPDERVWIFLAFFLPHVALGLVARRRLAALGLLVALGWLATAVPRRPVPGSGAQGPSVVLLTLDTFRADHLGALGGAPTPALDRLAAEGLLFRAAESAAPLTAPAHASLLSGQEVTEHGLLQNGRALRIGTVIPAIRAAGYRTGAFLAAGLLDRRTGLDAGFDHYDDRWGLVGRFDWIPGVRALGGPAAPSRRGDEVVARALAWLRSEDTPAFLWIHLYDPHAPYLPPEGWQPDASARAAAAAEDAERRHRAEDRTLAVALETGFVATQKLFYAAEIRWTDHVVGTLLDALPADTAVIAVGDHGESLDEHGVYFNHGGDLFEPALHVPLIVRWPGHLAPAVDDHVAATRCVGPTLESLAGLPPSGPTLLDVAAGRGPVARAWTGGMQARTPLPGTAAPTERQVSERDEAGRILRTRSGASWYALPEDPGEERPLSVPEDHAAAAAALVPRLDPPEGEAVQEELLRQLGYH